MSGVPSVQIFVTNPPAIRIGGRGTKTSYQYTLHGSDIAQLYDQGTRLMTRLQDSPLLSGVTSDLLNRSPIIRVHIDRQRAASLGVTPSGIEQALANAFNQQQVSTIFMPTNQYYVVMETVPSAQLDANSLEHFFVPVAGRPSDSADRRRDVRDDDGPAECRPLGTDGVDDDLVQSRAECVPGRGDRRGRAHLAATCCRRRSPADGPARRRPSRILRRVLGLLLLITIFIIYIILGILYESFIHPITILTGLPFAAFGALFALYVTHVELGVYGYVGIIMLIGIVEKNAIMMIDFALARQRSEHIPPALAIVEAASVRFRPIMMTTVSAIVGTLPIAIGVGTSAASRRPLGIAVVGGLAFSQIVTLYVTPVFYTYFDELQTWLGRRRARRQSRRRYAGAVPVAGD